MENVPGILTMSNGQVKETILKAFADIGYPNASVRILEAAKLDTLTLMLFPMAFNIVSDLKSPGLP